VLLQHQAHSAGKEKRMNIRKPIDYSAMFTALDALAAAELPQMKLYCEIGRLVSGRLEKGAAVAAAEYLQSRYPEASGFSPRNLRRIRDFYSLYENSPQLVEQALRLSWTQNVVIMEADLSMEERAWYLRACARNRWSKSELQSQIDNGAHLEVSLDQFSRHGIMTLTANRERGYPGMTKVLFICHGNICRSPMAEFVMKDMVKKAGLEKDFQIASAATSTEEIGKPGLSSGAAQAGRAWDTVRWAQHPSAHQSGLRRIRPSDWHGPSESPQYVPHLRRGLCRQDAPPAGLYRPPRRCSRSVVHGRFRGDLSGCGSRLPRAA